MALLLRHCSRCDSEHTLSARSFGIVSSLSVLGIPCPDCPDVNSIHRKGEAATRDRKVEFSIKLLI